MPIHFFSTKIRSDDIGVARISHEKLPHRRDRGRDVTRIGVIKGEPHSENNATLKATVEIRGESGRISMVAAIEQIGADERNGRAVDDALAIGRARRDVDNTHDDCR